jgi:thiamine biosynthesis protein ThiS
MTHPSENSRINEMQLSINGERRNVDSSTIAELLAVLGVDAAQVAVERNREIVPKSQYDATGLADGDAIEIVEFIGGG